MTVFMSCVVLYARFSTLCFFVLFRMRVVCICSCLYAIFHWCVVAPRYYVCARVCAIMCLCFLPFKFTTCWGSYVCVFVCWFLHDPVCVVFGFLCAFHSCYPCCDVFSVEASLCPWWCLCVVLLCFAIVLLMRAGFYIILA